MNRNVTHIREKPLLRTKNPNMYSHPIFFTKQYNSNKEVGSRHLFSYLCFKAKQKSASKLRKKMRPFFSFWLCLIVWFTLIDILYTIKVNDFDFCFLFCIKMPPHLEFMNQARRAVFLICYIIRKRMLEAHKKH